MNEEMRQESTAKYINSITLIKEWCWHIHVYVRRQSYSFTRTSCWSLPTRDTIRSCLHFPGQGYSIHLSKIAITPGNHPEGLLSTKICM